VDHHVKSGALLALLLLCACGAKDSAEVAFDGDTMGTQFNVKLVGASVDNEALAATIETVLNEVEKMMSTFRPDSEISTFNNSSTTDHRSFVPALKRHWH